MKVDVSVCSVEGRETYTRINLLDTALSTSRGLRTGRDGGGVHLEIRLSMLCIWGRREQMARYIGSSVI